MSALLVATSGGHLAQLFELARRLGEVGKDRIWVTFDNEQSRSLLEHERKHFIPFIGERDLGGVARGLNHARQIMRDAPVSTVVSTGSAIALSFLPYAAARGIEAHYIESSARVGQPSLTGRVLEKIPGITLYRQYESVATRRWHYGGSVFDGFEASDTTPRPVRRAVVTLGTVRQSFRRLVERLVAILPPDVEVLWQTGHTPVDRLNIDASKFVPGATLDQAMRQADVVIAHGGCGSALGALKAGKYPVLVPRDARLGELVDGHQIEITGWLSGRDLALERTPEQLAFPDLELAASRSVVALAEPPSFHLVRDR